MISPEKRPPEGDPHSIEIPVYTPKTSEILAGYAALARIRLSTKHKRIAKPLLGTENALRKLVSKEPITAAELAHANACIHEVAKLLIIPGETSRMNNDVRIPFDEKFTRNLKLPLQSDTYEKWLNQEPQGGFEQPQFGAKFRFFASPRPDKIKSNPPKHIQFEADGTRYSRYRTIELTSLQKFLTLDRATPAGSPDILRLLLPKAEYDPGTLFLLHFPVEVEADPATQTELATLLKEYGHLYTSPNFYEQDVIDYLSGEKSISLNQLLGYLIFILNEAKNSPQGRELVNKVQNLLSEQQPGWLRPKTYGARLTQMTKSKQVLGGTISPSGISRMSQLPIKNVDVMIDKPDHINLSDSPTLEFLTSLTPSSQADVLMPFYMEMVRLSKLFIIIPGSSNPEPTQKKRELTQLQPASSLVSI